MRERVESECQERQRRGKENINRKSGREKEDDRERKRERRETDREGAIRQDHIY